MNFEWDERKRLANIVKHGIDFRRATDLFDGRPSVDLKSTNPDETRFLRIALLGELHVTAVWTLRDPDYVRLISVRRARDGERKRYRALYG